jgi:hypothetical protein
MKGGKRKNAGRPKGQKDKLVIRDYFTLDDIEKLVETAKKQAESKPEIMKFLLEQVFGKARQNIGIDGGEENKAILVRFIDGNTKDN